MATSVSVSPPSVGRASRVFQRLRPWALPALLTPLALLVHGYHPYAEDGGIYLAGVKLLLHPELFPYGRGFAAAHLHLSAFAWVVAAAVRMTGMNVMSVMLALQLASIFCTLAAADALARRMWPERARQQCAVMLLAAALTVPVAGTSLVLMDPYATARSLALPCVLAAFSSAVEAGRACGRRRALWCGTCVALLIAATALHPLSGGYGAAVVLLFAALSWRRYAVWGCVAGAFAASAVLQRLADAPSLSYRLVAETRTYWFLSEWAWYEVFGLVAPVLLLLLFARSLREDRESQRLLLSAVLTATVAVAVALLFAHAGGSSFGVARVQPLRAFHAVYVLMVLCLGSRIAEPGRRVWLQVSLCVAVAAVMFVSQRSIYPHTDHLELPGTSMRNAWEEAFVWIRENTPVDAVVAMDADYIAASGEDAQSFRALSERSMPADRSKDGGIAAAEPALAELWASGVALQNDLNGAPESRLASLYGAGVTWVVVPLEVKEPLPCPYRNRQVAVCRVNLPQGRRS